MGALMSLIRALHALMGLIMALKGLGHIICCAVSSISPQLALSRWRDRVVKDVVRVVQGVDETTTPPQPTKNRDQRTNMLCME